MGFFDSVKKVASSAMSAADKMAQTAAKQASNEQLKEILQKNPNNKYAREEANRRGL